MANQDDDEFGAQMDDAPRVVPAELPDDDELAAFSPEDLLSAQKIREFSLATIFMELFTRACKTEESVLRLPINQWPGDVLIKYGGFIGSLGSNRMSKQPVGDVDWDAKKMLKLERTTALMAAIMTPKMSITSHITDGSLAQKSLDIRGVSVRLHEGKAAISVPGCPFEIIVAIDGPFAGRVVSNGQEFVEWHNAAHQTSYHYVDIGVVCPAAIRMAFFLHTQYECAIMKEGGIRFIEKKHHTTPLRSEFEQISDRLRLAGGGMRGMIHRAYEDPSNRPAIGHKADPVSYLEYVCMMAIQTASEKTKGSLARFIVELNAYYRAQCKTARIKWVKICGGETLAHDDVVALAKSGITVCGHNIQTHGGVANFVEKSRAHVRNNADLSRKSDTPGWGSVGASSTSVPYKMCLAIGVLDDLVGKRGHSIDAFGTGGANHWARVIEQKGEVQYFDKVNTFVPPLGGKFDQRDVEMLAPGCGVGKTIFDDTFNGPDNAHAKAEFNTKVASVVSADYDCGFLKLYIGAGLDGPVTLTSIPRTVSALMEKYVVVLSPGGSPHSPEFFAVFAKAGIVRPGWQPPVRTAIGYDSFSKVVNDKGRDVAVRAYVRGWIATRCVEIIRANIMLNLQIVAGFKERIEVQWPTYSLMSRFVSGPVPISGTVIPSARPSPSALAATHDDGSDDFGTQVDAPVEDSTPRPPDVGKLGAGNSKGDGPFGVIDRTTVVNDALCGCGCGPSAMDPGDEVLVMSVEDVWDYLGTMNLFNYWSGGKCMITMDGRAYFATTCLKWCFINYVVQLQVVRARGYNLSGLHRGRFAGDVSP